MRKQVADRNGAPGGNDGAVGSFLTVVFANAGMKRLAGSFSPILPSSTSDKIATLVIAFVCEAIRKIVSVAIRRPASLSLHPTARS